MKKIALLIMIFVLPSFGQKCEWLKTIEGVWQGFGVMSDHYLLSDNNGNIYTWGGTANNKLAGSAFTYTSPVNFVASYGPDGSFRWIRTFTTIRDVDVDPEGFVWVVTQTDLLKLNISGDSLLAINHPASHILQSVKCSQGNAYTVSNIGGIFKYDKNGVIVSSRTDGIRFTRVLKVDNEGLHMLGTYNGVNVSIDGLLLPDIPDPCNCIGAFYTILDQDLKAKCASQTTGSATKTNMTAAFITSTGDYLNARAQAYNASEIILGNCNNPAIYKAKISVYLGNNVVAFADNEGGFLCAHTSRAEPAGSRLSVYRFNRVLDLIEAQEWEGLSCSGITTTPDALYLSGFVQDTTAIDEFKMIPGKEGTYFVAKFKLATVGLTNRNSLLIPRIFPNPFHTSTHIELPGWATTGTEFIFTDIAGKQFEFNHSVSDGKLCISRSDCSSGIYFCHIRNTSGENIVLKLLAH